MKTALAAALAVGATLFAAIPMGYSESPCRVDPVHPWFDNGQCPWQTPPPGGYPPPPAGPGARFGNPGPGCGPGAFAQC